jgi:predicted glycoside hydrolase/deacetylase ChbG (UPF0249 family)
MDATRYLVVIADDYGMGPETSRGIQELAAAGVVSGAVLIVNTPYATDAVVAWRKAGIKGDLGWHPNLTMDAPCAPAERVPSLIGPDGCLWPLGSFIRRVFLGRIRAAEVDIELRAQYDRFLAMVGHVPRVVNSHQHVAIFPPVGDILLRVLSAQRPLPYLRRVREPWTMLARIPGARIKRTLLTVLGRRHARAQHRLGFPGADWLAGITDPPWVTDPEFFARWLNQVPGRIVELACHPGYHDAMLIGRDCGANDGLLRRRVDELHLLRQPRFLEACRQAGFHRATPSALIDGDVRGLAHAA